MASVQFYGADAVLQAAANFKCPAWAIFINNRLFTKYEGTDEAESLQMLENYLNMMEESNSNGIYTLKFFESTGSGPVKINEKTVTTGGSFNFKLIDEEQRAAGGMRIGSVYNVTKKLESEIELLKKQLAEKNNPEPEEPQTLGAIAMDLLRRPEQLAQLIGLVRVITGHASPAEISGFAQMNALTAAETVETDSNLDEALDQLEAADPQFDQHMMKLANLAKRDPGNFQMLLKLLDSQP